MMTLEALKSFASREWSPSPGQVKTCSDELAADLINAGYARPVVKPEEKKAETVEVAKDENKSGMKSEKKIFKIFKPIKKNIVKKENKEDSDRKGKKSKIQNSKRWWNILNKKGFNKSKKIKNGIDVNNLYKVNVRDNLSWNKVCVNQVRARPFYKNIYETFL